MIVHRRLLQLAGSVRAPVAACVTLGLAVSASYVTQALLLASTLTELSAGRYDTAVTLLAWAFAVVAVRAVLLWARQTVAAWAGALIRARLRDRLVEQLGRLGPAYLTGARTGRVQTTLVDGVEGLDAYFSRYLPQVVITFCVPVTLVGWLFTVNSAAAGVLAAAVGAVLVVPRLWDASLLRRGRARWTAFADLASDYLEAMQGMATLRAFGAAGRLGTKLAARAHELYLTTMSQLRISLVETGVSTFLIQAGTAGAVLAAASAGAGDAWSVFAVLTVTVECFRPVRDLSAAWHAGYLGVTAVDGLEELLSAKPAVDDTGTVTAFPAHPEITFRGVTFTYPGGRRPAVRNVTFTVREGETVALVGPSGAGKSTLAALLQRLFDPDEGVVTIGGRPLGEFTAATLRSGIAVVAQDTYLFHGTVADNLRLARPDASDADLERAARAACAHAFVTALPQGYATPLGERGATLSGGQRQRLAIARALLADAPVLLLDEATSHVDGQTEQALSELRRGRTCLLIAHRLSTVGDADRIVVLDDGAVTESGVPAALAASRGHYHRLLAAQEVSA
ncbi:ABC-type multidrug transport system fused ATPase/permease subunit [Streptosporangium becharense]|uniref:ABC-type multidrug transport system fused ATPase/permease subunit n=1 Tax=Streptosporangium becharense TaxID=1816182 RepID=A0A7W9IC27_9ACTN|nr:ABC transporter ATP-binding protein [Streptosporangium becharense]MBB2910754.1 ABC-type multidrug transport system fused ATPase/permease subunit [Streptosporangium becharense]MBB5817449.1 ABC-type multidrug transport system fused ATPase/permease subunit [Streptosporangium becharense]